MRWLWFLEQFSILLKVYFSCLNMPSASSRNAFIQFVYSPPFLANLPWEQPAGHRVQAVAVVDVDPINDERAQPDKHPPVLPVDFLVFQRAPESFHDGLVNATPWPARKTQLPATCKLPMKTGPANRRHILPECHIQQAQQKSDCLECSTVAIP